MKEERRGKGKRKKVDVRGQMKEGEKGRRNCEGGEVRNGLKRRKNYKGGEVREGEKAEGIMKEAM